MSTLEIILLIVAVVLFATLVFAAHRIEDLEERNERNVNFLLTKMIDQQPPVYRYPYAVSVPRDMLEPTASPDRSFAP